MKKNLFYKVFLQRYTLMNYLIFQKKTRKIKASINQNRIDIQSSVRYSFSVDFNLIKFTVKQTVIIYVNGQKVMDRKIEQNELLNFKS